MPRSSSPRFHLADLVFGALMCGAVVSLFAGPRGAASPGLSILLIFILSSVWTHFRSMRRAPTCEECGRRFLPTEAAPMTVACPRCGREQPARRRSSRWIGRAFWGLAVLTLILGAITMARFPWAALLRLGWARTLQMVLVIGFAGIGQLLIPALLVVGFLRLLTRGFADQPCRDCGATIPADAWAGPKVCPACRPRHISAAALKQERGRNLRGLLRSVVVLGLLGSLYFGLIFAPRSGPRAWILGFLLASGLVALGFVGFVAFVFVTMKVRGKKLRTERGQFAMARRCAGREGEVVDEGPLRIWYSGPEDPAPIWREEVETSRRRFETMTGGASATLPPHRVLVFHEREGFVRFHQKLASGLDLALLDGIELGAPFHFFTLCTAPAVGRIVRPRQKIRLLTAFALLKSAWGPHPPIWLQNGLGRAVAVATTDRPKGRLNRKMVAALGSGTEWSAEIFAIPRKEFARLVRGPKDPEKERRLRQFGEQSWSIVEYLVGDEAPTDRRAALGAFLRDPRSKADQEGSFRDHFGLDFATLLDGWRRWVQDRGIGAHEPPTPEIRDELLRRVLPVIRDRKARLGHRLTAIREWASWGHVLGADALIDGLRDPGEVPAEEIVRALRSVSGMTWGDEPGRWQAWWDDLPMDWGSPGESPETSDESIEVVT